jgi:hypothetical protein
VRKRIICLLKGHQSHCLQEFILTEKIILHRHICLRCERVREFEPEPIADEMLGLLLSLVGQPGQTAEEPAKPKHYIN